LLIVEADFSQRNAAPVKAMLPASTMKAV
jgi:hypothetical protein